MNEGCLDCKPIVIEKCTQPVCEIMPLDKCIKNTVVDIEYGINMDSTTNQVTLALIREINSLKLEISKLKKQIK